MNIHIRPDEIPKMKNYENTQIHSRTKKKLFRLRYKIAAVVVLLLFIISIAVLITQEPKPDPESEALIRETAAHILKKEPNELTDVDFAQLTEFSFDQIVLFDKPAKINKRTRQIILTELSDIEYFKKFPNLQSLSLFNIGYPERKIPKFMKILAKFNIVNLEERYCIDLKPLRKLVSLRYLDITGSPVKNIESLSGLLNLEELRLRSTLVSDIEPVRNLVNLRTLDIRETPVSDLEPVKNLKNLERLLVMGCPDITDEQIQDLREAMPELEIIDNNSH